MTWNSCFDYQGACDLVYLDAGDIAIHIRTSFPQPGNFFFTGVNEFSFISEAAMSLRGEVLQVHSNKEYFVDNIKPVNPPDSIGGFRFLVGSNDLSIDLGEGQWILISFFLGTISLEVSGSSDLFGDSKGFLGSFSEPAHILRDGSLLPFTATAEPSLIAAQWAVDPEIDPALLQQPPPQNGCIDPVEIVYTDVEIQEAEDLCQGFSLQDCRQQNCIFDTLASNGDARWAENRALFESLAVAPACETVETCVVGIFNSDTNSCEYAPLECGDSNQRCDPVDGSCVAESLLIPCIAVIDETSGGALTEELSIAKWDSFRKLFPRRPFCLLQPPPCPGCELFVPPAFETDELATRIPVNRDSQGLGPSDWYELCNIAAYATSLDKIALFIDNTGSLGIAAVRESLDLFLSRLRDNNLELLPVEINAVEDWIQPFLDDFA